MTFRSVISLLLATVVIYSLSTCTSKTDMDNVQRPDSQAGFDYLAGLEGEWIVDGGEEGIFGWEFELTSRGGVILERLKVGTPAEMTTVYHLDDGLLIGKHFCQLQNQPTLSAVVSETEGDLHFLCDGNVGNTKSNDELHMHGVHFQRSDKGLVIWMDMMKDGEIAFETRYHLQRADSTGVVADS